MEISFTTTDGVTLFGDVYQPDHGVQGGLLLLHTMTTTKTDWAPIARQFAKHGFVVLAIDFRGHGKSTQQGTRQLDHHLFSVQEHRGYIQDAEESFGYLTKHFNLEAKRCGIVGASVGANTALVLLHNHEDVPAAVALSPGLDYRSITTPDAVAGLVAHQAVLFVAARQDRYAAESTHKLDKQIKIPHQTIAVEGDAHGIALFDHEPHLTAHVTDWLVEKVLA